MPVSYTNRKDQTYTLYKGQTKTGKPRYYFSRTGQTQDEQVAELPPGYSISESVNGIVSLVKDRPSSIQPEEVAAVEEAIKQHPEARQYRISVKHDQIEIYERTSPHLDTLLNEMPLLRELISHDDLVAQMQAMEENYARYTPVLRFTLLDRTLRQFSVKRMCYRSSIDGWLTLMQTGTMAELAGKLIPTLGTDQFYELW
jgi:hypothetical protein